MDKTCGIFLFVGDYILLVHPTQGGRFWSIPKGKKESSDPDYLSAAFRELKEETSIDLNKIRHFIPEYLGSVEYKSGKKILHGFQISLEEENGLLETRCESFFKTKHGAIIPENDDFAWVKATCVDDLKDYYIHETQIALLDKYFKSRSYKY